MATEAQIAANRANAQKSTGPRTPEGRAAVSQNAVKHGLLAREGVLRGEDWEEFERHREMLLEELRPVGALEVILATRIVDLTWQLRRAAQDRNETFGALYDRHTADKPEPADRAERGATLGRMILEDYEHEAVLERLLRYERRIEGSFCRILNELRRVHDQGRKADAEAANTLERWREEDEQARKARTFAPRHPPDSPSRSDGGTTNTPRSEVREVCDSPSWLDTRPPANLAAGDEMCETNPICSGPDAKQVPSGTGIMSDSASIALRKTNPISVAPRGTGIPPVNSDHGRDGDPKRELPRLGTHAHATCGRDGRATHGRDAHATERPGATSVIGAVAQGKSCETKPIGTGAEESQMLCGAWVTANSDEERPRENKANFPVLWQGRSHPSGQPAVAEADSAKHSQPTVAGSQ